MHDLIPDFLKQKRKGEPFSAAFEIVIPANTAESDREAQRFRFNRDVVIEAINLHVPAGHHGEVPILFEMDRMPYLPTFGRVYRLDNAPNYPVLVGTRIFVRAGQEFGMVGWNEDVNNEHTTRATMQGYYLD